MAREDQAKMCSKCRSVCLLVLEVFQHLYVVVLIILAVDVGASAWLSSCYTFQLGYFLAVVCSCYQIFDS